MKILIAALLTAFSLAACTHQERTTATGAAVGAVAGGIIGGDVRSAAVGAAIGGAAGLLIGSVEGEPGQCWYEDRKTGEQYKDDCPT